MSLTPLIPHHHIPSLAYVAQPHGGSSPSPRHVPCLSAPTSLTAAPFFVGAAADDDDKPTISAGHRLLPACLFSRAAAAAAAKPRFGTLLPMPMTPLPPIRPALLS
ncbi:MAG: hypothetical protein JNJ78_23075 [Anaerolineae bacterium]|nr:hypothetical protein [Anaerolineae bacterium]